jgi:hypothetical protein
VFACTCSAIGCCLTSTLTHESHLATVAARARASFCQREKRAVRLELGLESTTAVISLCSHCRLSSTLLAFSLSLHTSQTIHSTCLTKTVRYSSPKTTQLPASPTRDNELAWCRPRLHLVYHQTPVPALELQSCTDDTITFPTMTMTTDAILRSHLFICHDRPSGHDFSLLMYYGNVSPLSHFR